MEPSGHGHAGENRQGGGRQCMWCAAPHASSHPTYPGDHGLVGGDVPRPEAGDEHTQGREPQTATRQALNNELPSSGLASIQAEWPWHRRALSLAWAGLCRWDLCGQLVVDLDVAGAGGRDLIASSPPASGCSMAQTGTAVSLTAALTASASSLCPPTPCAIHHACEPCMQVHAPRTCTWLPGPSGTRHRSLPSRPG